MAAPSLILESDGFRDGVVRKASAHSVRVNNSSRLSGIIWVAGRRLREIADQTVKFGPRSIERLGSRVENVGRLSEALSDAASASPFDRSVGLPETGTGAYLSGCHRHRAPLGEGQGHGISYQPGDQETPVSVRNRGGGRQQDGLQHCFPYRSIGGGRRRDARGRGLFFGPPWCRCLARHRPFPEAFSSRRTPHNAGSGNRVHGLGLSEVDFRSTGFCDPPASPRHRRCSCRPTPWSPRSSLRVRRFWKRVGPCASIPKTA